MLSTNYMPGTYKIVAIIIPNLKMRSACFGSTCTKIGTNLKMKKPKTREVK